MPEPPAQRPPEHTRHSWTEQDLKSSFRLIYGHRSNALHGGIPFPAPMCNPPAGGNGVYAEKPAGLAHGKMNTVWLAEDIPMLLQTFEYIVRNALLKWWKTMIPEVPDV